MLPRLLLPWSVIRTGSLLIPVLALPIQVSAQSASLSVNAAQTVRTVDERVFGVNAVTWDWQTANAQTITLLQSAGIRIFRIPGGSAADGFHWKTDNAGSVWGMSAFSQLISGVNAQAFVTVNYGSGTPQEAAAWVAYANLQGTVADVSLGVDSNNTDWHTAGYWSALRASAPLATDDGLNYMRLNHPAPFALKYWEIGNECYGSWENDTHAAKWDPVTYANVAKTYIAAMKAVDPTIKIGAVAEVSEDALDSKSPIHTVTNPVTGVTHDGWTPVMLTQFKTLGVAPDFLIYHRYEQAPGGESDATLLMAPENGASQAGQGWAADAAGLRMQLKDYLGTTIAANVELDITENNSVYTNPGKQSTSLVNGLYLADSLANVMQTEFNSLVWWDLRNGEDNTQNNSSTLYGWRMYGDYGILATPAGQSWGDPSYFDGYPAYYTMKLMSHFARGGDTVVTATSGNTLLPIYAAKRADGSLSLLLINKSPTNTYTGNISLTSFVPLATATVYSYGIPQDNAAKTGSGSPDIATITINNAAPAFSVPVAPYSATVISLQPAPLSNPVILTQPVSQTPTSGQSVVFSATASGNPTPTYQWQRQAAGTTTWTNLTDSSTYSGSSMASLTVNSVAAAMNGDSFRCVVTNSGGTVTTTPAILVVETPLAVVTFTGQAGISGHADGSGAAAQFNSPADVAVDSSGNVYVADSNNNTVRKITPVGAVTTLAGQTGVSGSNDGSSSASFNHPAGIAVDGAGNAYIADTNNNTIRKLVIASGAVTTLAGQAGVVGSANGTGTAASFNRPSGVAVDSTGNLYVADTLNHTIRKVTAAGAVTTIAGTAGSSGFADSTGSAAQFHGPQGLALDSLGNLFVADTNNNAIRMIVTASGVVSTVAGQAGIAGSIDGAVSQAQFHYPSGVAVDLSGNLYVMDTDNHALREIAPSGAVSTLAGLAGSSGSADGIGTAARFDFPTGVAVMSVPTPQPPILPAPVSFSVVYVADTNNDTIRLVVTPLAPVIATQPQSVTVTAGQSATFTVAASGQPAPTYQWNFNGGTISGATSSTLTLSNTQFANGGSYTVTVKNIVGTVTSNAATLTVTTSSSSPAPSGGGGGGGAPSVWFCGVLSLLAFARRMLRRK
jgi:sugar lactone lactonase YvrE